MKGGIALLYTLTLFQTTLYAYNIFRLHFPKNDLKNEPYVIIVVSTQGEGDPPDNAKGFFRWLGIEKSDTVLQNVNFTVYNL